MVLSISLIAMVVILSIALTTMIDNHASEVIAGPIDRSELLARSPKYRRARSPAHLERYDTHACEFTFHGLNRAYLFTQISLFARRHEIRYYSTQVLYNGHQFFVEMKTCDSFINEISSAVDSHDECIDQLHVMEWWMTVFEW